jgi:hypothetical protein
LADFDLELLREEEEEVETVVVEEKAEEVEAEEEEVEERLMGGARSSLSEGEERRRFFLGEAREKKDLKSLFAAGAEEEEGLDGVFRSRRTRPPGVVAVLPSSPSFSARVGVASRSLPFPFPAEAPPDVIDSFLSNVSATASAQSALVCAGR